MTLYKKVIAIQNDTASIGWIYADGVFTNPSPPVLFNYADEVTQ